MRNMIHACVVLVLFSASSRGDDKGVVRTGALTGQVVDVDGRPVAGARVWLQGEARKILAETRTDANGRYRLESIPVTYSVELLVDAEGFGREFRENVRIFPGMEPQLPDVVVAPGREVIGRILDERGQPRAGLELECIYYTPVAAHSIREFGPSFKVKTDVEGQFRVLGVPPCSFEASAQPRGYETVGVWMDLCPGRERFQATDTRMVLDKPIVGTVRDQSGQPLAGIKVETNVSGDHGGVTNSQGRFALPGIVADTRFRLIVDAPNFTYVNRIFEVEEREKPVEIVLKPCAYISGRVVDAGTGDPIRFNGLSLCLARREPGGRIVRRGCRTVDAEKFEEGRFRLSCDPSEDHCLTINADGYQESELFIDRLTRLAKGDNLLVKMHRVDGEVLEGQRITGVVTDGRSPVPSVWVSLHPPEIPATVEMVSIQRGRTVPTYRDYYGAQCLSSQEGTFSLRVPHAGPWFVAVDEPDGKRTMVGPVEIGASENRKIDINTVRGGAIVGQVADVPGDWTGCMWVVAFDRKAHRAEARVRKDGTFRLENLPPGEYGLKVGHDGYTDPEVLRAPDQASLLKLLREAGQKPADPWREAVVVQVTSGSTTEGVELNCPQPKTQPRYR